MVFEPAVVFINKGDSVNFISVNKGHNVASMNKKGSAPEGASKWKSKISKDYLYKFDIEGIHGIKCKPHQVMGMVGAVVVGNTHNLKAFSKVKLTGKAKKRFPGILATIKSKSTKQRSIASEAPKEIAEKAVDVIQLQKDVTELKTAIEEIKEKLSKLESK
jgi:pseudoazurin